MSTSLNPYCIVIPHYNHARQLAPVLDEISAHGLQVFIIDDGSNAEMRQELARITKGYASVTVEYLGENQGKGAAVVHGMKLAAGKGHSHAIQIDADGQHAVEDLPKLIAASEAKPASIISAMPVYGPDVPKARLHGRKLTTFCVMVETLSNRVQDAMCGFRVYPIPAVLDVSNAPGVRTRMQFDIEVLVRWSWAGGQLEFVPSKVRYPENGLSHFRMVRDNFHFTLLHTRLIAGMLVRLPVLIVRRMRGPGLAVE